MAPSPAIPAPKGLSRSRILGKTRLVLFLTLMGLLAACVVSSWMTRGSMALLHGNESPSAVGATRSLVNLRPWETAQALASLAVSSEENEFARDAERLADHEVDQAFAAALRQARLQAQHTTLTGEAQAISQKVVQLEQLKMQDQALVNSLTPTSSGAAGSDSDTGDAQLTSDSDDLEVAKAQLGLDSDELADAQRDLDRASGDNSSEIQDELTAHEASMQKYDREVQRGGQIAVLSAEQYRTGAEQVGAWFSQRKRKGLIEQARQDTENDVRILITEHNTLEAKAAAEGIAGTAQDHAKKLASLQDRSVEHQILSIYDDRIQTEQQLAAVYANWSAQVQLQHHILLHMILKSLMGILLILLGMFLCDSLMRRLMAHPVMERRQMRTLQNVFALCIQALGLGLILLTIFGSPRETPTILGLATAALTIALQDYILAFLGWFVLMGKNGIHVGDWVEINGVSGEVTEIGLMTTTLMETGGLADQGHPTGRRISFMNGFAIRGQYFNFSTAGQWMWDEITMSVPVSIDIHAVMDEVRKVVVEDTQEDSRLAEQEWKHGAQDEGLGRFGTDPLISLRPSGSGADLHIRYVTSAFKRFDLRNRLYQRVVELLNQPIPTAK